MNPIDENLTKGTFGELLVQIKLLQYGVQAAPPIKDSGNDLIAIRKKNICAIQVKTRSKFPIQVNKLPESFHLLSIVVLDQDINGNDLSLDKCKVYLLPNSLVKSTLNESDLTNHEICQELIEKLFPLDG